jgi:hypothetical protein
MTDTESGLFDSSPKAVFYLVANEDAAEGFATERVESLDEQSGVQATLDLTELAKPDVFDQLLRRSKLGSRWGKDLSKEYREYLRGRIEQVDESGLVDEFEAQFGRYDADPYESAVLGDAITIGIDLPEQVQKALDEWEQHQFTRDDLAAAVGIAAKTQDVDNQNTLGGIIFQSDKPFSEIKQDQTFIRASRNLQQLLLIGLDIALIAPVGQPDEKEVIENAFRGVGSFSIESTTDATFNVSDDIAAAVDEWYGRLRYDVADNRVVESVVRPASVTAYDLPDESWVRHFKKAVTIGLQGAYSEKSFNEDRFDELWDNRISSHPNYDQYRSRRNTFPEVKVTRKSDENSHEFRLHHKGPSATPYISDLPVRSGSPEKELVDWIERFLDADHVSEQRWQELVGTFDDLSPKLTVTSETLTENALLHRQRQRNSLSPLIPPVTVTPEPGTEETANAGHDPEWYDRHWSAILSDYKITKQGGVGAIKRKRDLQHSLDPGSDADVALYYKLEQDIDNAWEYFLTSIGEELKQSLTEDQNLSIDQQETQSGRELNITITPENGESRAVTVEVLLPYSDVSIDGTPVRKATVTNTVNEVIDALGTANQTQNRDFSPDDRSELLYDLTKIYLDVAEFQEGELVYFDDIIEFCLSLPGVRQLFERPDQDVEAVVREHLGSERYITRLRESAVKFHRKGSDQHGSVKVQEDRYIAMELQELLK